ncbi:MAG: RNA polymerase factor sigma-54, partial [Clostridium sp.]|nr:RNA polymerase factor sigma-54 [Clostridium sp.]
MRESLEQTTEQRLQQSLSPLQLTYARTLEMNGPEFDEEVRHVVDENPALEVVDESPEEFNETSDEMQLADYADEDDIPPYRLNARNRSADDPVWTDSNYAERGESLGQMLTGQLADYDLSPFEKRVAEYVIGCIDDNGYLSRSVRQMADDLAVYGGLDVSERDLDNAVALIRTFDPPGVGATDLREALMLQLDRIEPRTAAVENATDILRNHFQTFIRKDFRHLSQAVSKRMDSDQLREAIDLLRSLNPKPGSVADSSDDRTRQITPDFEVEPDGAGGVTLSMPNTVPQLRIEEQYNLDDRTIERRRRGASKVEADALTFIRRKRDEATDFIRAVSMRQQTLWNVMRAIIRIQKEFFTTFDRSSLRPMILKDVASLTGYDLSVISRATSGKYVGTPLGIYPLKFFFNEKPKEDLDASAQQILDQITEIVGGEDKHRPLSDEAIAAELASRGYEIARRTVAKYRERL